MRGKAQLDEAKAFSDLGNISTQIALNNLTNLLFLVPTLAAGSRRLHDIGKSGWWQLIGLTGIAFIILIVWWATGTAQKDNKYGPLEQS